MRPDLVSLGPNPGDDALAPADARPDEKERRPRPEPGEDVEDALRVRPRPIIERERDGWRRAIAVADPGQARRPQASWRRPVRSGACGSRRERGSSRRRGPAPARRAAPRFG